VSGLPQDDRELEAFLARATELQRDWRALPADEPPAAVDSGIRAAARRAVGAEPGRQISTGARRWRIPLAVAATVLLGSTLTLMLFERDAHRLESPPDASTTASPPASEPVPAPLAPEPLAPAPAPTEPEEKRVRTPRAPRQEAAQAPAAVAPAAGAPSAADESPASDARSSSPRPEVLQAPAPRLSTQVDPHPGTTAEAERAPGDPEAELERIRLLLRDGKLQEAEERLRAFRLQHPDYSIPEDLAPASGH